MVLYNQTILYVCPYCNEEYKDEDDAQDCANDCVPADDIIEKKISNHECEMCHKTYKVIKKAIDCEVKHKEKDDLHYNNYLDEQSLLKLKKASKHKEQTKLVSEV